MKEFNLIKFQDSFIARFQEVDRRYRWRTSNAARRRLIKPFALSKTRKTWPTWKRGYDS